MTRTFSRPVPVEPYWRRVPGAAALLRAIAQEPDDDAAHLALADLCEEHGELGRAEFIRLAVDPARCGLSPEEAEARAAELFAVHGDEWCVGLPDVAGLAWRDKSRFVRGLLCAVALTADVSDEDALEVLGAVDVRHFVLCPSEAPMGDGIAAILRHAVAVRLDAFDRGGDAVRDALAAIAGGNARSLHIDNAEGGYDLAEAIAATPAAESLDTFELSFTPLTAAEAEVMLTAPLLRGLRRLTLWGCELGPDGADVVASWRGCRSLTHLDLGGNSLGNEGAEALARSPHVSGLRELRLGASDVGSAGSLALARSASLAAVEVLMLAENVLGPVAAAALGVRLFDGDALDLEASGIGDDGLASLLAVWDGRSCRTLNLSRCGLTAAGVSALAGSRLLASVEELTLGGNHIGSAGVAALCRSPYLAKLRRLSLNDVRPTRSADGRPWRWPPGLRELLLSSPDDGPAWCAVFAAGIPPAGLRSLSLTGSNLTQTSLPSLLDALPAGLETLVLSFNPIGGGGARWIAAAPGLGSLRELDLYRCRITAAGVAALLASPTLRELVHLNAGGRMLTAGDVRALAAGPCPPLLRTLCLRVASGGEDAVEELKAAAAFRGVTMLSVQFSTPRPDEADTP